MADRDRDRERITLVFEPLPCEAPPAVRIRRLLKYALRSQRLKCVRITGEADVQTSAPLGPSAEEQPC
jgi:hypothetical protein